MKNNASDFAYPLITVIVAVFNGVETLQQCINSVAEQTYPNKELIIIDGGSDDGTITLLENNQSKISYWISEPDSGIYNAWNKGIEEAKGEWICFLGADDYFWDECVLAKMSISLQNTPPSVRLSYAQIMLLGTDDDALFPIGEPWEVVRSRFKRGECLPHPGMMHRRSLFIENGDFDESFQIGGDYELMLRELKTADAAFIPDLISVAMRPGGVSNNPSNTIEVLRDVKRARIKHNQPWPIFFWFKSSIRVYARLIFWKIIGETVTRKLLDLARRIKGLQPYWTKTQ